MLNIHKPRCVLILCSIDNANKRGYWTDLMMLAKDFSKAFGAF